MIADDDAPLNNLLRQSGQVKRALKRISTKSGVLPFSMEASSGYCIDFLVMKLMAACIQQQNLHKCDWSDVDKASLQGMSGIAKKNFKNFTRGPADSIGCDARYISYFLTGRADWGLFASMFAYLWQEVADRMSTKGDRKEALVKVQSQQFLQAVQFFWRAENIAPHPAVAYDLLSDMLGKFQVSALEVGKRGHSLGQCTVSPSPLKKRKRCASTSGKKLALTPQKTLASTPQKKPTLTPRKTPPKKPQRRQRRNVRVPSK